MTHDQTKLSLSELLLLGGAMKVLSFVEQYRKVSHRLPERVQNVTLMGMDGGYGSIQWQVGPFFFNLFYASFMISKPTYMYFYTPTVNNSFQMNCSNKVKLVLIRLFFFTFSLHYLFSCVVEVFLTRHSSHLYESHNSCSSLLAPAVYILPTFCCIGFLHLLFSFCHASTCSLDSSWIPGSFFFTACLAVF